MVEHQGAVGLRGGMYICTQNRKDTCSATSVHAEASYMNLTSALVHSRKPFPTQIEKFLKTRGMETCDAILCRLRPHAGER
eukprot:4830144-Pyramimonas_sp.AAC.1